MRPFRVRNTFDAPCFDLGEFMQQLLMDQLVRGEHLAAIQVEWAAVHVCHDAPRLFHQQDAGGGVPGIQLELPEGVHAAGGNTAQVKTVMHDWIDYMQMARWNGEWKIVNVLWEMKKQDAGGRK